MTPTASTKMPPTGDTLLSSERQVIHETSDVREGELSEKAQDEKNKEAWQRFIDYTLVEWGKNISDLEDENFEPPNIDIINLACTVATELQDKGWLPPTRIVPDGEGGISFEHADGTYFVSLNIYSDRSIEMIGFDDCRLDFREQLS